MVVINGFKISSYYAGVVFFVAEKDGKVYQTTDFGKFADYIGVRRCYLWDVEF